MTPPIITTRRASHEVRLPRPALAGHAGLRVVLDRAHARLDALSNDQLGALLPALREVRAELARALSRWVSEHPGQHSFGERNMRAALLQVRSAVARVREMKPEVLRALSVGAQRAALLSIETLRQEVAALGAKYGEVAALQFDVAARVLDSKRLLMGRYRASAERYVGQVAADIRLQLAVGVLRNETFAELKARLVKLRGPRGPVALRGNGGAEEIAEGLFRRYRFWGERLVRTEMMHAYNAEHARSIADAGLEQRWDSSIDFRLCPLCRGLDGQVRAKGDDFVFEGLRVEFPPAHPLCRCVIVPWSKNWG